MVRILLSSLNLVPRQSGQRRKSKIISKEMKVPHFYCTIKTPYSNIIEGIGRVRRTSRSSHVGPTNHHTLCQIHWNRKEMKHHTNTHNLTTPNQTHRKQNKPNTPKPLTKQSNKQNLN